MTLPQLAPMLAAPARRPPARGKWAVEIKWDGFRALTYLEGGEVRLVSRAGNRLDDRFPELRLLDAEAAGGENLLLDGEIVTFDAEGLPSFALMQRRVHRTRPLELARAPATYMIFDLLHQGDESLLNLPYVERRARLAELALPGTSWQLPGYETEDAAGLLEVSRQHGLEGLVLKRMDSPYEPGRRSGAWLKLKNLNRREFVIGGWLPGTGNREGRIGALLLGAWDGGELRYMGRVGTGFTGEWLELLGEELAPLRRPTTPFDREPPRGAVHTEPTLVAEVEFHQVTADGMLRHSSFKGLRADKPAAEVTWGGQAATEVAG